MSPRALAIPALVRRGQQHRLQRLLKPGRDLHARDVACKQSERAVHVLLNLGDFRVGDRERPFGGLVKDGGVNLTPFRRNHLQPLDPRRRQPPQLRFLLAARQRQLLVRHPVHHGLPYRPAVQRQGARRCKAAAPQRKPQPPEIEAGHERVHVPAERFSLDVRV